MAIKRIDSYLDIPKLKAEHEELSQYLIDDYNSIVKLFNAITTYKGAGTMSEIIKGTKDLDIALREAAKTSEELAKQKVKNIQLQTQTARQLAEEKLLVQQLNKENKNRAQISLTTAGSIARMEAVVARLRASQKALNLETEEGQKKNALYIKSIDLLNTKIKDSSDAASRQRQNVGNYEGSAKIIVDALEKEKKKLEELEKTRIRVQNAGGSFNPGQAAAQRTNITGFAGGGASGGVQQVAAASAHSLEELDKQIAQSRTIVEGFTRATENPKFLNIAGKVGDATAEIKFFTKSLIELERQDQGNGEAAVALRNHLAKLTDQVSDAKAEIKALSSDTRSFDLFAGSISFAADAFQTFAGAAVLAGASEEDAAEATKTLVAVQAVANGVKGIANELTTRGTAANKVYAYSQQLVSIATDESAAATARLAAAGKLLLGVGLIALIGYAVTHFKELKEALGGVNKTQEAYNETLKDYQQGAQDAITNTQKVKVAFDQAREGVISKEEALKIYNETLGDAFGKTNSLSEAEKLYNDKAADYITAMGLKAQANALFAKSAEAIAKGITAGAEDQTGIFDKLSASLNTYVGDYSGAYNKLVDAQTIGAEKAKANAKILGDELFKEGEKLATQAQQLAKKSKIDLDPDKGDKTKKTSTKSADDRIKAEIDAEKKKNDAIRALTIENANERIRIAQKTIDDENALFTDQLKAIDTITEQKRIIALTQYAGQVEAEEKAQDGKRVVILKSQKELELALAEHENKNNVITDEGLKTQQEAYTKNTEKIKAEYEKQRQAKTDILYQEAQDSRDIEEKQYNDSIIALNKSFELGLISQEEYNKERESLEISHHAKSIQQEIDFQKKLLSLSTLTDDEKKAAWIKLSQLQKELSDTTKDHEVKNDEERRKSFQDTVDAIADLATSLSDLTSALITAGLENQLNANAEKKKASDESYSKEIENINNSTLSEEQKAARLAILAKEKETRDIQYEQRQKELNIKKAKADKATAIFQAVINTAAAVAKALPNIALAALAGALGAIQIATIVASPIPKYAKGLDDNPVAHHGIYGEAGAELIEKPGQQPFIADRPTLDFLPVGTSITPLKTDEINHVMHGALLRSMANGLQYMYVQKNNNREVCDKLDQLTRAVNRGFGKQKPVKIINKFDSGWNNYVQKNIYN